MVVLRMYTTLFFETIRIAEVSSKNFQKIRFLVKINI